MNLGCQHNYHKGRAAIRNYMPINLPVPYDFCIGVPISHLLTVGSTPVQHSVLNVNALVGDFYREKVLLIGAFSVIVKTDFETDGSCAALVSHISH